MYNLQSLGFHSVSNTLLPKIKNYIVIGSVLSLLTIVPSCHKFDSYTLAARMCAALSRSKNSSPRLAQSKVLTYKGTRWINNRTDPLDHCALTGALFLNGLEELDDWLRLLSHVDTQWPL